MQQNDLTDVLCIAERNIPHKGRCNVLKSSNQTNVTLLPDVGGTRAFAVRRSVCRSSVCASSSLT